MKDLIGIRIRKRALLCVIALCMLLLPVSAAYGEEGAAPAMLNGVCTTDMQGFCNRPEKLCDNSYESCAGVKGRRVWCVAAQEAASAPVSGQRDPDRF